MKILDRYLIREVVLPSLLSLLVLTFVLEIPPILREGEQLIAKGVELATVAHVLLTIAGASGIASSTLMTKLEKPVPLALLAEIEILVAYVAAVGIPWMIPVEVSMSRPGGSPEAP